MGASPYYITPVNLLQCSILKDLARGQFSYSHFHISEFTKDNVYSYQCVYVLVSDTRPQGPGVQNIQNNQKIRKKRIKAMSLSNGSATPGGVSPGQAFYTMYPTGSGIAAKSKKREVANMEGIRLPGLCGLRQCNQTVPRDFLRLMSVVDAPAA